MSQFQLAVELGKRYDRAMIGHVEHNRSALLFDGATRAAQTLGVSIDYLAGLTDDPTPAAGLAARAALADETAVADRDLPEAAPIGVHRFATAAGSGAMDIDESIKTYAYFRREWLRRKGLTAGKCSIIGVMGDSMEPTLPDGCVILVDQDRTQLRHGGIFVLQTEEGLIVKRTNRDARDSWQLVSDNDSPEWPTAPLPSDAVVRGEVKWMAREL